MASSSKVVFKVNGATTIQPPNSAISFTFEGTTYNFSPSNKLLGLGKYKTSDSTTQSAANIVSAIQTFFQNGSVITAETEGDLIIVSVTDQTNTNSFTSASAGTNIEVVEIIDADSDTSGATGTDGIDITLINHQTTNFYSTENRDFLYGEFCDIITTTIEFETLEAITYVNYKGATIENSIELYSQGVNNFEIDPEYFRSTVTNDLMRFTGTFGTLSDNNPKTGIDGTVTFTDLGSNQYRIVHVHQMQRALRPEDLNGQNIQTPEVYDGENSIKYVFEIECRNDLIDPEPLYSTKDLDLTNFIKSGNVGFTNEFLNGNEPNYILNGGFVFNTDNEQIDRNQDSEATFQILNSVGAFTAGAVLELYIQEVTDQFETLQNLQENLNIDRVLFLADGSPVSSSSLIEATATVNANTSLIDVSFKVAKNTIEGQYYVKIAVSNDNANINHNNIDLQVGTAGTVADETTINFDIYPNAPRADYNFNVHYNNDIANSYNSVVGFVEDRYVARFRVVDSAVLPVTNTLVDFQIELKNKITGNPFTTFVFTSANIPLDSTRNFKLAEDDNKNLLQITETSTGVWDFTYGFQLWETWISQSNLVFELECTFDQLTETGDIIQFTKSFQSPFFTMGNYDTTLNTVLEPNVLRSLNSIQFYDNDTGIEVKGIVKGRDTRIYATFQDDNFNDLQVSSANELAGYLGINNLASNQFAYEMFHSTVSNDTARPWRQPDGDPDFNALITLLSIKKCSIEAVLVWDKFRKLFPENENFRVTARIDKVDVGLSCITFYTDFNPATDGTFDPSITSFTGDDDFVWQLPDGSTLSGASISTTGNGFDGTPKAVSLCSSDLSKIESIDFQNDQIIDVFDATLLTNCMSFRFSNNNITSFLIGSGVDITTLNLNNNNISGSLNLSQRQFSAVTNQDNLNVSSNNIDFITFSPFAGVNQIYTLNFDGNNLSGLLDLSSFSEIDTLRSASGNSSVTSIDVSNLTSLRNLIIPSLDITGTLDLSSVTFNSPNPNIQVQNQNNMTQVLFSLVNSVSSDNFLFQNGSISDVQNLELWSGLTSTNNATYRFDNNDMNAALVNKLLVAFDTISVSGFTNRDIFIGGNNAAPDSTSGGFDGLAAIASLTSKVINVFAN